MRSASLRNGRSAAIAASVVGKTSGRSDVVVQAVIGLLPVLLRCKSHEVATITTALSRRPLSVESPKSSIWTPSATLLTSVAGPAFLNTLVGSAGLGVTTRQVEGAAVRALGLFGVVIVVAQPVMRRGACGRRVTPVARRALQRFGNRRCADHCCRAGSC